MQNAVFQYCLLGNVLCCFFVSAMPCDSLSIQALELQVNWCEEETEYRLAEQNAAMLQTCYEARKDWRKSTYICYRRAYFASEQNESEQVQILSKIAEELAEAYQIELCDDEMAFVWNKLAYFYQTQLKDYDEAEKYYIKTIIADSTLAATTQDLDYLSYLGEDYQNLATLLSDEGDYEQAIDYYQKALTYLDTLSLNCAIVLSNLAYDYQQQNDFEQADLYYKKAIQAIQRLYQTAPSQQARAEIRSRQIVAHLNYASFHNRTGRLETARRVLAQVKLWLPKDDILLQSNYATILGGTFVKQKEFKQAEHYWFEALALRKSLPDVSSNFLSDSYRDIAKELFVAQDSLAQALRFYNLSIATLQDNHSPDSLPPLLELSTDKLRLLTLLSEKANVLVQLERDEAARQLFDYALNLIDDIRLHYYGVTSKYHLLKTVMPLYENALQFALKKGETDKAFDIAERSKAILLSEQTKKVTAAIAANISPEMLEQERDFRSILVSYERKLSESKNEEERTTYREILFKQRRAYQAFIAQLEKQYPSYHQLKYQTPRATVSDIRAAVLNEETALLEYFVGEMAIYLFVLTENDLTTHTFPKTNDFEQQIQTLRLALAKPDATFATFQIYTQTAWQLHHQYLQAALIDAPKKADRCC